MKLIVILLFLIIVTFSTQTFSTESGSELGEYSLGDILNTSDDDGTSSVVALTYDDLKNFHTGNPYIDTVLNLSMIRQGVSYTWGGNEWMTGVDCSHFTMKVYQAVSNVYNKYYTTNMLRKIEDENGLYSVSSVDEIIPGDLLVYGQVNSETKEWAGHVVIVVDKEYKNGDDTGLVVGSHGGGLGVRFITYKGFPHFYKQQSSPLHKILRVRTQSLQNIINSDN